MTTFGSLTPFQVRWQETPVEPLPAHFQTLEDPQAKYLLAFIRKDLQRPATSRYFGSIDRGRNCSSQLGARKSASYAVPSILTLTLTKHCWT